MFKKEEKKSLTARRYGLTNLYFDSYNTAFQLNNQENIQIYHKSKLMVGVEKMPFPSILKYFEKFARDLGGTVGSLGIDDDRLVFYNTDSSFKVAPVICYESVFGEFTTGYIKNGANFIAIITNDGWWGDTPGYKQHLIYGALRAIETRRSIARSANTGTSCFINIKGEISQPTNWWEEAVIQQTIELNEEQTFYVKHGNFIGKIASYIFFTMLLFALLIRFKVIKK
jgi:apolipoprotein N-acyltransferase